MIDRLAAQAHGLWVCIKALPHSLGQTRTSASLNGMSVLPSTADVVGPPQHVRVVPSHKVAALQPAAREQEPRGR